MSAKPSVLFVCVHNAGRSQDGGRFLAALAGDTVEVRSAGSAPADAVNLAAVAAMAEVGIDISTQSPKNPHRRRCRGFRCGDHHGMRVTPACSSPAELPRLGPRRPGRQGSGRRVRSATRFAPASRPSSPNSFRLPPIAEPPPRQEPPMVDSPHLRTCSTRRGQAVHPRPLPATVDRHRHGGQACCSAGRSRAEHGAGKGSDRRHFATDRAGPAVMMYPVLAGCATTDSTP